MCPGGKCPGGKCPRGKCLGGGRDKCPGGKCPGGKCLGGKCLGGKCPGGNYGGGGKCPGGKCPGGKCPRTKQRPCRNSNQTEDSPEVIWRREIFYLVLDQIMSSIKSRFDQNKEIFDAISLFSPKRFASLLDNYMNCEDLAEGISALCVNYGIDKIECARELMSFAATCPRKEEMSM